jgi:8-oxo-dGTP pyrophosphatase MutT (NUDIX family)
MEKTRSVGVIVYADFPEKRKYLLIQHASGHWAFPKGHIEKEENDLQAATRELWEETGITDIELKTRKAVIHEEYKFSHNGNLIHKEVDYFIAKANNIMVKVDGNEVKNFMWAAIKKAKTIITYQQTTDMLLQAEEIILKSLSN